MRILIVDDSRSMRLVLKRMLAQMGHDEAQAEDGSGAAGYAMKQIVRDVIEEQFMLLGLT